MKNATNNKLYTETVGKMARIADDTSSKIINTAEQWLLYKAKDHFGKEYFIDQASHNDFHNAPLYEFIKKYDKNFEFHYDEINDTLRTFVTLIRISMNTFMYIATGTNVPGKMKGILMEEKNNSDLYIYIFGKKAYYIGRELEEALKNRQRRVKGNRIYTINEISMNNNYITSMQLQKREMRNMYYSFGELDRIREHIDHFNENFKIYKEKQLLYKTGILLYGEPGTGKSSLAKAIATDYARSIVTISMNNVANIDFSELSMLINNDDYDEYVVLLEDIDTLFLNRDEVGGKADDSKSYNDIINQLLQFLDSNTSPNNVIFIATTNHLDRIDQALLRDGRFDLKVEVRGLKKQDVHNMVESFGVSEGYTDSVIRDYQEAVNNDNPSLYNQSKLQNIIIKYIH